MCACECECMRVYACVSAELRLAATQAKHQRFKLYLAIFADKNENEKWLSAAP